MAKAQSLNLVNEGESRVKQHCLGKVQAQNHLAPFLTRGVAIQGMYLARLKLVPNARSSQKPKCHLSKHQLHL